MYIIIWILLVMLCHFELSKSPSLVMVKYVALSMLINYSNDSYCYYLFKSKNFPHLNRVTSGDWVFFPDEPPRLKHEGAGLLSMPIADRDSLGSHFIITFAANHNLDRYVCPYC